MFLEIYELDPARFLSAPALGLQAATKKAKVNLDFLTDIDMVLVIEGMGGWLCHAIYGYVKPNNKYKGNHDKNKEPSYLN